MTLMTLYLGEAVVEVVEDVLELEDCLRRLLVDLVVILVEAVEVTTFAGGTTDLPLPVDFRFCRGGLLLLLLLDSSGWDELEEEDRERGATWRERILVTIGLVFTEPGDTTMEVGVEAAPACCCLPEVVVALMTFAFVETPLT